MQILTPKIKNNSNTTKVDEVAEYTMMLSRHTIYTAFNSENIRRMLTQ